MKDLLRADGTIFSVLQETEEFHLGLRRQAVDLIQKQRAAFGLADQPRLIGRSASERAAFVAEDLAFHQVLWKRAAIDRNEWPVRARTQIMNGAREDFLAGAGLAGDQHRRVAPRESRYAPDFFEKRGALADDLFEADILLEFLHERIAAARDSRLAHQPRQQFGTPQWRQQKIRRAHLEHSEKIERIRMRRSHQHWAMWKSALERRKKKFQCLLLEKHRAWPRLRRDCQSRPHAA